MNLPARFPGALLLVLGGLSLAVLRPPAGEAAPHKATGLRRAWARVDSLARAGRWEQVLAAGDSLQDDPRLDTELTWRLHQVLGLAARKLGRDQEALAHLEKAVLWGPSVPENHRNLASLLMALGRKGRALSEYAEACQVAPDDPQCRVDLANARMDLGLLDAARRSLDRARELAPHDPAVLRAEARWNLLAGREAAAAAPLRLLLDATGDRLARRQLALVLLHTGRPDSAAALYVAVRRETLDATEQRLLLEVDRARGDPGYALRLAGLPDDSLSASPAFADPDLWATAAMVCLETGHPGLSVRLWDRALALDPDNAVYRNNRRVAAERRRR